MEDSTIGLTEASDDSTTGAEDVTGARRLNNGDWVGDGLGRRLAGRFPWVAGHLSWGVAICVFIVEFIPNLIAWRYLYPGFLQADHAGTIAYYAEGHLDPWHSVFWALIAKPLLYDSPSYGMYGILPVLVFSGAVAFSITRLARLGIIRMPGIAILAIVFALSPNYLLYNQLYSSDILFAILLIPYTVLLTEVAVTRCHALHRPTFLVGLAMLTWVILELRKNALVVPMLALVVLLIVFHREWRRILVALLVPLVVFVGGNAVFDRVFDVHVQTAGKTTTQELLSVPSVQVGRVYSLGLPIPDDIDALLTEQRPAEYWTNHYLPYNADLEKEGLGLTPDFVTGWLRLGKLYPGVYKDAYWALEKNYVLPASSGLSRRFRSAPGVHGSRLHELVQGLVCRAVPCRSDSAPGGGHQPDPGGSLGGGHGAVGREPSEGMAVPHRVLRHRSSAVGACVGVPRPDAAAAQETAAGLPRSVRRHHGVVAVLHAGGLRALRHADVLSAARRGGSCIDTMGVPGGGQAVG